MKQTIQIADSILDLADRVSDRILQRGGEFNGLAAAFIARASQSLQSTCILANHGFLGDSLSVARTIIELDIDLAYIRKEDTARRIVLFCEYERVANAKIARAIDELHDGKADAGFLSKILAASDAAKSINPNPKAPSWAGIDIAARAGQSKRMQQYSLGYREACGASHSGMATLRYSLAGTPENSTLQPGPGAPNGRAVYLACISMLCLIGTPLGARRDKDLVTEIRAIAKRMKGPRPNKRNMKSL